MQPHRIDPLADAPILPAAAPSARSVVGLGLTDVLRVELQPCQIPTLLAQLDALRGPLTERLNSARARWEDVSERFVDDATGVVRDAHNDLTAAAYSLRVLAAVRDQLPTASCLDPVTLVGPAGMVSTLIASTTTRAATQLSERISEAEERAGWSERLDRRDAEQLRELSQALAAWLDSHIDCHDVEWYRFDPNCDPARAE